jgi:Cu-Zn family superoxide dismutase
MPGDFMIARSVVLAAAVFTIGCVPPSSGGVPTTTTPAEPAAAPAPARPMQIAHATATIRDGAGRRVGDVTFTDSYAGVIVVGTISGLGLGAHGIHIHEFGKCQTPFTTAGGHFNPDHHQHGYSNPAGPHLGDMPNVDTPAAGPLKFEFVLPNVTLKGRNALLDADGAAIVVHAARDDYATDPAGDSGGRIACGVITG